MDGDRIIASADEGGGCVMLDLDGNELLRTDAYLNWLSPMYGDTPSLCATTDYLAYDDKGNVHAIWHVYDRDGNDFSRRTATLYNGTTSLLLPTKQVTA